MREFVIDANVLMSILISGKSSYKQLLTHFNFILPDFVLIELDKYNNVLLSRTKMQRDEFVQWTYLVFSHINILPHYVLNKESLQMAKQPLEKIDLKDTTCVALAMQLDLTLLTRDKKLYEGLRKQGFKKIKLFEKFLQEI